MMGFLAWVGVFWAIALPYSLFVIGNSYDGWGEIVSQILVTILAWILANKAERRANLHYYGRARRG